MNEYFCCECDIELTEEEMAKSEYIPMCEQCDYVTDLT